MKTNLYKLLTENVNGTTFISITTNTVARLKGGKSNPHLNRVRKIQANSNVMVFQNSNTNGYDNAVKKRLEKEGKDPSAFVLQPRKWGERIPGTPFIFHKGKYYLEVIFLHPGEVHYEINGHCIDPEDIIGLNHAPKEAEQGGLDNKVVIRTFSVESIQSITINKNTYDELYFQMENENGVCLNE